MHETSLVRSLLRQVSDLLAEHQGESVESIRVEMGPLSGVERTLVEIAFADQVEPTPCRGAQLVVEEVPLSAQCVTCRGEIEIEDFQFLCPQCASTDVRITGGDEFRLLDVGIRIDENCLNEVN